VHQNGVGGHLGLLVLRLGQSHPSTDLRLKDSLTSA
jgi:hypothetical protein